MTSRTAGWLSHSPKQQCTPTSVPGSILANDPAALFGEGPGQVILAFGADEVENVPSAPGVDVRRIGEVGGDEILGATLADLRAAWESVTY